MILNGKGKSFGVFFLSRFLNVTAISQPLPVSRQGAEAAINCALSSVSLERFGVTAGKAAGAIGRWRDWWNQG